jgi:UDP-N-acetylmuramate dehydrogenase
VTRVAAMPPERFEAGLAACVGASRIGRGVPLAPMTTFKVGGPADWLVEVATVDELQAVSSLAREAGVPVTLLGGGSNVLVGDRGVRGVVVHPKLNGISQPSPDRVRAEAGVTINGLVRWTVGRGIAGIEAWAGTPGTVGGAIYGNAHYNGRNIGDLVARVMLVSTEGQMVGADRAGMAFAYDTSRLKTTGEILVWAEFETGTGEPDRLRETARASLAHRKRTQPLESPSAGCIFQNPDRAIDPLPAGVPASAGALVDRAGLKGARQGQARISETHANFFVNEGGATAADIRALIERARAAVREQFGVALRDEIVMMGEF